jgi:hypothetical protein
MGAFLRRYPVPLIFLAVFGLVSAVQAFALSAQDREELIGWASTNLANLAVHPVGAMVSSAFISEDSSGVLLVISAVGLFSIVRRFGNLRSMMLIVLAHVVGTVVSQGIVFVRLEAGQLSSSVRTLPDVGPSYVVAAALVAAILYGPGRWPRVLALVCWCGLAPYLFQGLFALDVAAVGHVVAMFTGALVGAMLRKREQPAVAGVAAPAPA